ncbi:MAG: WD40 repeat domain-containing protein, partial [Candidatus Thorarchaeota archaeon]
MGREELSRLEGELIPNSKLEGHEFTVWSVAVTQDGKSILSGGQDTTIRFWDIENEKEIHKFIGHDGPVYGLVLTPDGKRLVSIADKDLAVKVWDLEAKTLVSSLAPNSAHVNAVAISPDQRFIVTGGNDGITRFWDVDRGVNLRTLEHQHSIYSLLISPDNRYLLCGSKHEPLSTK